MPTADVIAVHLSLLLCTMGYAAFLNIPAVHDWYTPDHVYLTVIGGNFLIGMHLLALCWLDVLPYDAFWYLVSLNCAAGLVIVLWQIRQSRGRRQEQARRGRR